MKFILFNVNDTNKNILNKIQLDNINYINEVSLSKKILDKMEKEPKGVIQKLKYAFKDKNIERKILKALGPYDKKWYYILANSMLNNKYLTNKAQHLLGYKLASTNELDANIFKYVDEYLGENDTLKKHELKVLVVANSNKNLNITLLENLIKEYKSVNVYLKDKPSSYIVKRIKQINKNEGTTIDILKKERKVFKEYNVIYFVDDVKENYPRFRLDKNSLVIDISLSEVDKFNSNIIFLNEYIIKEQIYKENIDKFLKEYNNLQFAGVVRKIANELDKS
ncbi:MAG: hypothetical protein IJ272_02340 [Clostridia bacterium]|nr:hypothetical protein [Clostridia bacterium]